VLRRTNIPSKGQGWATNPHSLALEFSLVTTFLFATLDLGPGVGGKGVTE